MKCSTAVQHYIGTNYTATAVHHAHKVFIENTECLMLKKKNDDSERQKDL